MGSTVARRANIQQNLPVRWETRSAFRLGVLNSVWSDKPQNEQMVGATATGRPRTRECCFFCLLPRQTQADSPRQLTTICLLADRLLREQRYSYLGIIQAHSYVIN